MDEPDRRTSSQLPTLPVEATEGVRSSVSRRRLPTSLACHYYQRETRHGHRPIDDAEFRSCRSRNFLDLTEIGYERRDSQDPSTDDSI
jgi:hypothetical protein